MWRGDQRADKRPSVSRCAGHWEDGGHGCAKVQGNADLERDNAPGGRGKERVPLWETVVSGNRYRPNSRVYLKKSLELTRYVHLWVNGQELNLCDCLCRPHLRPERILECSFNSGRPKMERKGG